MYNECSKFTIKEVHRSMLYPLLFNPIYKEMIWGGSRMAEYFSRDLPSDHTGESWDISCRPNEMSIIENSPLAGMAFDKAIAQNPVAFLGNRVYNTYPERGFPLLVKIIDANDDLSVQVHPDDAYALARGPESGKSEMWYIMEAPPGQSLIIGLTDDATPERLRKDPMCCLQRLPIKKGDIINIPAGLVHAITKGVMVAEIQQNSDITYRLYDYNRIQPDGNPRALHLEDGLAVADFDSRYSKKAVTGITTTRGDARITPTVTNPYFSVIKYEIDGTFSETSDPETFAIFTCVEGSCVISGVKLTCSRSVFIPAGLGSYDIKGKAILLKSFV